MKNEYYSIIKPKSGFSLGWKELWSYRELLFFFSWREIKIRYKQAMLGLGWTIIQPLLMTMIFMMVLSNGLGVSTGNMPAPLYYLSGLIIWNLFNASASNAAQSMVNHAQIIKKIYFPRLVIPISSMLTASFDFVINLCLFIIIALYYVIFKGLYFNFPIFISSVVLSYVIAIIFSFSIGTLLAAINVKYRDVRYIIPFLLQALFFISPVIYDRNITDSKYIKALLDLNPLNYSIELFRSGFSEVLHLEVLSIWTVVILMTLYFIAIFTFRRTEAYFSDII